MLLKILKSKLHRARVTDARLHYPGSIEIDENLMEKAGILPYEAVLVADLNNGNRLETYAVPAERGSGFCHCTPEEAAGHKPKVVVLDEDNKIVSGE